MVQPEAPESNQDQPLTAEISAPPGWAVGFIPTVGNTSIVVDNLKPLFKDLGEANPSETNKSAVLALHGIHSNITQPATRKGRPI